MSLVKLRALLRRLTLTLFRKWRNLSKWEKKKLFVCFSGVFDFEEMITCIYVCQMSLPVRNKALRYWDLMFDCKLFCCHNVSLLCGDINVYFFLTALKTIVSPWTGLFVSFNNALSQVGDIQPLCSRDVELGIFFNLYLSDIISAWWFKPLSCFSIIDY